MTILCRSGTDVYGTKLMLDGPKNSGNMFCHRGIGFSIPQKRLNCYQQKVQKAASGIVWGCISVHGIGKFLLNFRKEAVNEGDFFLNVQ